LTKPDGQQKLEVDMDGKLSIPSSNSRFGQYLLHKYDVLE